MRKFSKAQQKIIYLAMGFLISILFFLIFVFIPLNRKLAVIKRQLKDAETQIAQITNLKTDRELSDLVRDLQLKLNGLSGKLPLHEETVIKALSESAQKLKIKIKKIDPAAKVLLENKIPGVQVYELPIAMDLSSEFRALGEYLNALSDNPSLLIKIKQLSINGRQGSGVDLDVSLTLLAYLS